ncbi:MAG TPA: DUF3179 domain-containing (seleno)protein [Tepidisphaeraceae bacterium]|nr:DUF3179 domain-containing (seleno)protein [Tepidisphaeraceae bacterium]
MVSAGVVAYGTNAFWAQFPHGIEVILWSRRLEWPLVTLCLLLCLGVLGLVISGKRRAWWLIGLGPVLALFAHRFVSDPSGGAGGLQVVENPTFVAASDASFVSDDDYVVGLKFGDSAYAYPYSCLYYNPVVIQSEHDRRMMLIWSAFANRAVAETVTRELKARDLEIVSTPANALLLYNHTYGQFINGIKGQLMNGQKPLGFGSPVVVNTMTWKDWHGINPDTKVLAPGRIPKGAHPPTAPILPTYPMPPAILDHPITTPIVLVGTSQPAALLTEQVGREPEHVSVDGQPAFVFRDGPDKPVRAFSCFLKKQQLFTRFHLNDNSKYKGAMFVDTDTGSAWSANGTWVDGMKEYRQEFKGTRLTPVPVQDHLYWGVMKFWYPELQLTKPEQDSSPPVATSGS